MCTSSHTQWFYLRPSSMHVEAGRVEVMVHESSQPCRASHCCSPRAHLAQQAVWPVCVRRRASVARLCVRAKMLTRGRQMCCRGPSSICLVLYLFRCSSAHQVRVLSTIHPHVSANCWPVSSTDLLSLLFMSVWGWAGRWFIVVNPLVIKY